MTPLSAPLVVVLLESVSVLVALATRIRFKEELHVKPVRSGAEDAFLLHFSFSTKAEISTTGPTSTESIRGTTSSTGYSTSSIRSRFFQKSIAQIFASDENLGAFDATLTQGRITSNDGRGAGRAQGGAFRSQPPGATLIASSRWKSTSKTLSSSRSAVARADLDWSKLVFQLAGLLCASFEAMDTGHTGFEWIQPVERVEQRRASFGRAYNSSSSRSASTTTDSTRTTEQQQHEDLVHESSQHEDLVSSRSLLYMTLPYEPVCTENLTPLLRLLPCRGDAGLGQMLLAPVAFATAGYFSIRLSASRSGGFEATITAQVEKKTLMFAGVETQQTPTSGEVDYSKNYFGSILNALGGGMKDGGFSRCPISVWPPNLLFYGEEKVLSTPGGKNMKDIERIKNALLVGTQNGAKEREIKLLGQQHKRNRIFNSKLDGLLIQNPAKLRELLQHQGSPKKREAPARSSGDGYEETVLREILPASSGARSYGTWSLRVGNLDPYARRVVEVTESLPYFLQPLWHTAELIVNCAVDVLLEVEHDQHLREQQQVNTRTRTLSGKAALQALNLDLRTRTGRKAQLVFDLSVDAKKILEQLEQEQVVQLGETQTTSSRTTAPLFSSSRPSKTLPPTPTSVSFRVQLLKRFVHMDDFSFAAEKGFDVGAAAWKVVDVDEDNSSTSTREQNLLDDLRTTSNKYKEEETSSTTTEKVDKILDMMVKNIKEQPPPHVQDSDNNFYQHSSLHLTEGALVMIQMPDFSMPFNVVCLTATFASFFFSQLFRVATAPAGLS
ncbi:unnamed protein product [Amoebophrya sp. A25]|nr:unnamed protein product [Amoebophrya sp. A25]|eukprot:GSA25T00012922001.1